MTLRPTPFLLSSALLLATQPLAAFDLQGSTEMAISAQEPSYLGADLQALEAAACGEQGPIRGTVLLITHDGGSAAQSSLTLAVLGTVSGSKGTILAQVQPLALQLPGGAPLTLSCGQFDYVLVLDPTATQPVSELTLVPADASGTSGTCAGIVVVMAQLVLTGTPGGTGIQAPRPLRLRIAGQWVLAEGHTLPPGESPLVLLARPNGAHLAPLPARLGDDDPDTELWFEGTGSALAPPRDR